MAKSLSISSRSARYEAATWRDYYELTKPNVVMLLLLTALVGMCLATPQWVETTVLLAGLLGIGMLSASAAVINHVVDHRIDSMMARTFNRPVAKGKVSIPNALVFAVCLAVVGFAILALWVNMLTAWLTLASLVGYAFVYTMFLKRATPQNIVIGGLAGAAPPLLGWTAVTGEVHSHALLLVLIVFTWTPPHFWALALKTKVEYKLVNIPMLPNIKGDKSTKWHIFLYTLILVIFSTLPYFFDFNSIFYLAFSLSLGFKFIFEAYNLLKIKNYDERKVFNFSIIYLFLIFSLILIDKILVRLI